MSVLRKSVFVLCSLLLLFAVVSCLDEAYVEKVVIESESTKVAVGSTLNLKAKVTPSNATDKTLTWTTRDEEIATVQDGVVTGVKVGEATITATSVFDPTKKDEVTIKVVEPTGTLEVSVNYAGAGEFPNGWSIEIKIGDEIIGILNKDATSISKALVVDEHDGFKKTYDLILTKIGLDNYEVSYSATTVEIQKDKTSKVAINIDSRPVETVKVKFKDGSASSICVEDESQLIATVAPDNASNKDVKWTSSDDDVATVDVNGKVTGVGKGTATIRAASVSNPEVYDEVSIDVDFQRGNLVIQEDHGKLDLPSNWSITLKVGDLPSEILNGSTSKVTMNDLPIGRYAVSVTNEGLGRYRVTTEIANGVSIERDKTTTVNVIIEAVPVESVSLESSTGSNSLDVGQMLTLKATVSPDYATVQDVTWESDNKDVATVDGKGVVTGVAKGKATITATSKSNPEKTASFDVDVVIPMGTLNVRTDYRTPSLPDGWSIEVKAGDEVIGILDKDTTSISKVLVVDGHTGSRTYELTMTPKGLDKYKVGFAAGTALIDATNATLHKDKTIEVAIGIASIPVETVSITQPAESKLYDDGELTLTATVTPNNATDDTVVWTSSNTRVATVDASGKVTGVKAGDTVITATSKSNPYVTDEIRISVVEPMGELVVKTEIEEGLTLPEDWHVDIVKADESLIGRLDKNNTTISKDLLEGSYKITFNSNLGNYDVKLENGATLSGTIDAEIERGKTTNAKLRIAEIPVTSISITPTGVSSIYINDTLELGVTVSPDEATNKDVEWVSQDANIATVDEYGNVTGVNAGDTVITATSKSNPNAKDEIRVFVLEPTGTLVVKTEVENGLTPPEGWSISVKADDMDIFTLNENNESGTSTLHEGKHDLKITKSSELDNYNVGFASGTFSETTGVDIVRGERAEVTIKIIAIPVTGISLSIPEGSSSTICNGDNPDKLQLKATVTPGNATDPSLEWTSSNPDVATVDDNGLVIAGNSTGTAIITATSVSNPAVRSDEIHVHVEEPIGTLQVNIKYGELKLPEPTDWLITVYDGEEALGKMLGTLSENDIKLEKDLVVGKHNITWAATGLDKYNVVSSHPNSVNIKRDNKLGITITITEKPVESVTLNESSNSLIVGDTLTLTAEVSPSKATDPSIKWSSSNDKVATVDDNGKVTGVGAGEVTITATSDYDSTKKDSKTINVDWQRGTLSAKVTYDESLPIPANWSIDVYGKRDGDTTASQIGTLKAGVLSMTREGLRKGVYELSYKQTGLDNFDVSISESATIDRDKETPVTVTIAKRPVDSITLSPDREGSINVGDTLTLTPKITPANTTEQEITWTSSNEDIATVNGAKSVKTKGNTAVEVKAVGKATGDVTITAEIDGKSKTYTLRVDNEIAIYGRAQVLPPNFIDDDAHVTGSSGITVTATVGDIVLSTTTGSGGYFSFSDLPRGKVTFAFTQDGTSYGRDTFDYTEATAAQTPDRIMLIAISKSTDDKNNVTGYGSYYNVNTQQTWNGEWRVLDRVDNKALLVSSMILFDAPYSASEASWDTSDLKKYLNGDGFYNGLNKNTNKSIFTEREKQYIVGNEGDKVFLLSVEEVSNGGGYFNNDSDRMVKTMDVNTSSNPYKGWWLRTDKSTSTPPYVSENGYVHESGSSNHGVGAEKYGVRPAIWVQL